MAVFMINICKFNGCGITFPSLGDLIQHIEDTHIDYDPIVVEAKEKSNPSCLPLSYVLRFFLEDEPRKEGSVIAPEVRRKLASIVKTPSVRSNTPTGSEFDDEEMLSGQSEDSNDSWTNVEEFSSEFILRYGSRMNPPTGSSSQGGGAVEKPFACPVPGCKKRYKNVNGIKYHSKNGHKKDGKIRKGYKCHCGKSYRSAQGLKTHSVCQHFTSPSPTSPARVMALTPPSLYTQVAKPLSLPVVKALQGLVVQSSQNQINTSRHVTQVIDASHFDGNKVIRAVLESAGNKPTKEGSSSTITTLTLPRQNITTLQITNPNVLHHPKSDVETTPTGGEQKQFVFKTSSSTPNTHVYTDSSVSPNSLGILTPASSPRASPHDKMKTNFPLTPVTPSNETHPRFTLPPMMH